MNHPEIRIFAYDWESSLFQAWILQILLSELLDIPATIETGVEGDRREDRMEARERTRAGARGIMWGQLRKRALGQAPVPRLLESHVSRESWDWKGKSFLWGCIL